MSMATSRRLPPVTTLSNILPAGTEGGKEFARIIGLLLFHDSKKAGIDFSLFDDSSGDFEGLDSYSREKRSKEITGYQYKFFASPLSDAHRSEILKSLQQALERTDKLKLKKWIIVTPDDFKNSGRRKNGGDVSWFENLRSSHSDIEIEHFGHSKILSLFLQTHYLCLYYYPSLVPSGNQQQKSIEACRAQFDDNMRKKYGKIEFVGMSVYKDEASRRIPLEDIYIPLSVVHERTPDETEATARIDPYTFLKPGSKNIILGDPGSGKSTLVGFLALAGINKKLQERCKTDEDNRLTIVITLRRYADELKSRRNLPILDYIVEVARADFNMNGISSDFFSYYIESGRAILLFDGLDELPSREYKSIIRQRIDSFCESFPANTVLVTSRLVGYEAESRFDDSYGHYRVAKLRVNEIEKFINDWYAVRIEDNAEKNRNAGDLIKIIKHPDSDSIRELARNPLLLTIVALVHRIDAVLPDQRVVLYQKCTETLLNTWYKAKRQDEETGKGRIERRNRLRIEAIAYWMHRGSLKGKGRSVAPRSELIKFLTKHISTNESIRPQDELAEDQAENFVDFIKDSAGLLIEVGDELYSFIHLTFQEYLCATHLAAFGETEGTASIWKELEGDLKNPRWREVVRLLVASLRSTKAQSYFVERLLENTKTQVSRDNCLLLLGLLRDAIEPAENNSEEIITACFDALIEVHSPSDASALTHSLLHWLLKEDSNEELCTRIWKAKYIRTPLEKLTKMLLIRPALVLPAFIDETSELPSPPTSREADMAKFMAHHQTSTTTEITSEKLHHLSIFWALHNPGSNAEAAIMTACAVALDEKLASTKLFKTQLALMASAGHGPHSDHGINLVSIAASDADDIPLEIKLSLSNYLKRGEFEPRSELGCGEDINNLIKTAQNSFIKPSEKSSRREYFYAKAKELGISEKHLKLAVRRDSAEAIHLIQSDYKQQLNSHPSAFWAALRESELFTLKFMSSFEHCSKIEISGIWFEALYSYLDQVPSCISKFFSTKHRNTIMLKIFGDDTDEDIIHYVAWMILFDTWTWNGGGYTDIALPPMQKFIEEIKSSSVFDHPQIQLSILIHTMITTPSEKNRQELLDFWKNSEKAQEILFEAGWLISDPQRRRQAEHLRKRRA